MQQLISGTAKIGQSLSLARSWHKCERFEILGVACPFMDSGIEKPAVGPLGSSLEGPNIPTFRKPRLPRPGPGVDLPQPYQPDLGSRPRQPVTPAARGPLNELEFPTHPDETRFQRERTPRDLDITPTQQLQFQLSREEVTQLSGGHRHDPIPQRMFLPDGIPINPNELLRDGEEPFDLGDDDPEDEDLTPNLGEERVRLQNRQFNRLFQTKPDIWMPGLDDQLQRTSEQERKPLDVNSFSNYVQAANQAENSYAPAYAQESLRSKSADSKTGSDTNSRNKAIAATGAAAAIGAAAIIGFRGGGRGGGFGGMHFPSAFNPSTGLQGNPVR